MASAADFLDAKPSAAAFLDEKPKSRASEIRWSDGDGKSGVADALKSSLETPVAMTEEAAHFLSSLILGFPAYLGGGVGTLVARGVGTSKEDPQEVAERFSNAVTYEPRTEAGKSRAAASMKPLQDLAEIARKGGREAQEIEMQISRITGLPESPVPGALIESIIQMAPAILGLGIPRGKGKAAPTPEESPPAPPEAPVGREFPGVGALPETTALQPAKKPAAAGPPESPFPAEAANLEDVLPRRSATEFLEAEETPAAPAPVPNRAAEVADRVAQGEKLTPEEAVEFPGLVELEKSKEEFALRGQTETEARVAAARAADVERERSLTENAPSAEDFLLSGSKSPVDEARARGQAELEPAAIEVEKQEVAAAPSEPEVIQHPDGGFVLKPIVRSPAQVAAAKRQREAGHQVNPAKDDLATIMGKLGGMSKQALLDLGLDPADLHPKKGSLRSANVARPAVRGEGGLTLDGMAELLDQYGFALRDEYGAIDSAKLAALIDEHMGGKPVFAPEGFERQAALEAEGKAKLAEDAVPEEKLEGPVSEARKLQEEYGPGTLGANAFLDPKVIGGAVKDVGRAAGELFKNVFGEPGEFRNLFNPIRDAEQLGVARIERWAAGEGHDLRAAFPDKAARNDLTMRIVKNDLEGLTPEQTAIAKKLQANYRAMGEYAQAAERLGGLRQNYSPQVWDLADKKTRGLIDAWRAERGKPEIEPDGAIAQALKDAGVDPQSFSPFMLPRAIKDVVEGMKLGLKPKSLDAADLFETYARSMANAVERGKTLTALKELVSDDGTPMVTPREQAPKGYERINNPELEDLRVHPDVAPAVRVLVQTNEPGVIATALQTIAYTTKRALVSYSFFHPKALLEADIGAGGNPATAKGRIDAALKMYRDGGLGDPIDKGLDAGLKIGAPLEDVLGRDKFKGLLDKGAALLDRVSPQRLPAGESIRMLKAVDEKLQQLTWNYIHTGLKLDTFLRKFEDLKIADAEKVSKGAKPTPEKDIARQASEFTNSTFGGLNWERMLDSFDTPGARRVMSEVLSKQGRSTMQTVLFAPDWLTSTFSTWTNAFGVAERNAFKRQIAQRYLVTSAVVMTSLGNGLNYYFTGHSMFENKSEKKNATWGDQFKAKMEVQLGDGRRVNLGKHFYEVPHAIADPMQFALNKLNPVVSEPIEQLWNKQWLTGPNSNAPPIHQKKDPASVVLKKHGAHALEKFLPITGKQLMEQGPGGLGGFFGFPVYGMTHEQRAKAREDRNK